MTTTLINSTVQQTQVQSSSAPDATKIEHTITLDTNSEQQRQFAFRANCFSESSDVKMPALSEEACSSTDSIAATTIDLNFASSVMTTPLRPISEPYFLPTAVAKTFTHREKTSATTTSSSAAESPDKNVAEKSQESSEEFECDLSDKADIRDCYDDNEFGSLALLGSFAREESEMLFKLHSTDGNTELSFEHTQKNDDLKEKLRLVTHSCTTFFSLTSPTYQVQQQSFMLLLLRHANNDVNLSDFLRELCCMFEGIHCAQAKQIVNELFLIENMLASSTSFSFTMLHNDVTDMMSEANALSNNSTPEKADECQRAGWKTPDITEQEEQIFDSPGMPGFTGLFASPNERLNMDSPPKDYVKDYSPPQDRPTFSASFSLHTQSAKSTACFKVVQSDLSKKNFGKKTAQCEYVNCKFCGKVFKQAGIRKHMSACRQREVQELHMDNEPKIACVCCRGFFDQNIFVEHYRQCSGQHAI